VVSDEEFLFTGTVEVTDRDGLAVVALNGFHDIDTAPRVQRALSQAVDGGGPIVIDLSSTEMLDSTVLGSIITAHTRAANRGQCAVVGIDHDTRPVVRNLLRVTGIASSVDIYNSVDAAVQALGHGQATG
jgi:anti-anti-sigma factor